MSISLDHISQELGIGKKTSHQGFDLWQKCMADDVTAWKLMKKYNINDVKLTEELYEKVKPWLKQALITMNILMMLFVMHVVK